MYGFNAFPCNLGCVLPVAFITRTLTPHCMPGSVVTIVPGQFLNLIPSTLWTTYYLPAFPRPLCNTFPLVFIYYRTCVVCALVALPMPALWTIALPSPTSHHMSPVILYPLCPYPQPFVYLDFSLWWAYCLPHLDCYVFFPSSYYPIGLIVFGTSYCCVLPHVFVGLYCTTVFPWIAFHW